MKYYKLLLFIAVILSAHAYEGPDPLRDIVMTTKVTLDPANGVYRFGYRIENPAKNEGKIYSIDIFLPFDPNSETRLASAGLTQCRESDDSISQHVIDAGRVVPVGSESPNKWSCGYGTLANYASPSFGWGSRSKNMIKPGKSLEGFALLSHGLPAIRDVLIQPDIDLDRLSDEYTENVTKTVALENKVKWMGKVVGPKAPPKIFKASDFAGYLSSLLDQSSKLEWVKNSGTLKSLEAKLRQIQKKIDAGDSKTAKNVLGAFLAEIEAQNGKHLTSEGYALLKFNAKYLRDHL
jgi:hypothetical protein